MAENSTPQDFMAQMLDLQQNYLQGLGQFFNPGQSPGTADSPFEQWWTQFPKSGQAEFDDLFKNLSHNGLEMMQNPLANMQQPFSTASPGFDWFNQMNDQFQSWLKAGSPGQSVFEQMNEQFRQQLMAPLAMNFMPQMNNPFANLNPAAQLNSPLLNLLQNLFGAEEKNVGEQLLATLKLYQDRIMEMNSLLAQVGMDSLAELQKNIADQETLSIQALYENWMDISKTMFDEQQLTTAYKQLMQDLTEAGEQLQKDFEQYQLTLTEQLGLVTRDAYQSLQQEVEDLRAQVKQLLSDKAARPSSSAEEIADDFTVLKGIGAKFNEKLHQQGVKTFDQLASMSDEMLKNLDDDLQTRGKLFEQQWREQAEQFLKTMTGSK